jgi:uncharacterized paraquat-inducible protein A
MKSLPLENRRSHGPLLYIFTGVSALLMAGGWFLPMLTIRLSFDVPLMGTQTLLDETRSLFGTVLKLAEDGFWIPAGLICFFGMILPAIKTTALIFELIGFQTSAKTRIWIFRINKWAMADVFSLSILIAFFTVSAMGNLSAEPQVGFYVFTAYVLLTGLIAHGMSEKSDTSGG